MQGVATTIPWLSGDDPFPPVESALGEPNGLLAAGGDLSPGRLMAGYARGIFPWFGEGDPVLWWSPDPRMVLRPRDLHVSRSLRRTLRSARYRVSCDADFPGVLAGCAAPRGGTAGTWITVEMATAYTLLWRLGHAHSVEVWSGDALAGGIYGVALGRMFYAESMFSRGRDASKVALVHLVRQLERWGFEIVDCQLFTPHLASLGAGEMPRAMFVRAVERLVREPPVPSPWGLDADLDTTLRVQ